MCDVWTFSRTSLWPCLSAFGSWPPASTRLQMSRVSFVVFLCSEEPWNIQAQCFPETRLVAVALLARLALHSSVQCPLGTLNRAVFRGWTLESTPSTHNVPFSAHLHRRFLHAVMQTKIPPASLLDGSISAVWLFPAGKGVGYSSMWTLSIHDQWRGPALYTKLSRRAGLFYSQPCGFKQIAQTGELKQILSYWSKTWRENR